MFTAIPKMQHHSGAYPVTERFARWQEVLSGSFDDMTGPRDAADDALFEVEGSFWNFGKGLLFHARARGRQVKHRGARRIRTDQLDHYRVHLQRKGCERNEAGTRRNVVRAGQILITDMSREQRYELDDSERTVLVVPREMLEEALPRPMDLHGAMPSGAAARLLAHHLSAMAARADSVVGAEAATLMTATVQLIAGALVGSGDVRMDAAPPVAPSTLRQLCRYIDLHLDEPALSGNDLCAAFNLSRSALYRMFAPLGGVNCFIRERRLHRVHEVLSQGGARPQLARLAAEHGFTTASHFSRAFRDQFGYSPREAQRTRDEAQPSDALRDARAAAQATDALTRWLRSLRD